MASLTTLINRMTYWCVTANMGYSQYDRWNFNSAGGNCDCSSLVIHCLREAGFDTGSATYTGNLSGQMTARGWQRLPVDGNPHAGDILLNDANHVAVYLGGGMLAQASISEYGTIAGNAGDQTGGETNISPYYNYPWDCYLRFAGTQSTPTREEDTPMASCMIRNDDTGLIYYWSPESGNVPLTHPDQARLLGMAGVKLVHGSGKAPWWARAQQVSDLVRPHIKERV